MSRAIVKLKGHYLIWSSIVDAPIVTCDTLEELETFTLQESGESGLRELPERLKRVEARGTSANRDSAIDTIWFNRAGPNEQCLTIEGIYRHYCLNEPIRNEWIVSTDEHSMYGLVVAGWEE